MSGKYITQKRYGKVGGGSGFWRSYTELPSGVRLIERGQKPNRQPDKEESWCTSSFQYGGVTTETWFLTEQELQSSIKTALLAQYVFVGKENVAEAIRQLRELGFDIQAREEWGDKGYIGPEK